MRVRLMLLLWVMCTMVFAQNLTTVTVDIYQDGSIVDTQVFNGFTPSTSISENLTVNTAALQPGIHTFVVTITDDDGVKSILETGTFLHETNIVSDAQVSAIEYFYDNDPGAGNGLSITTSPATEIIASPNLNTSGLGNGFHTIHLRAQDENGQWGPYSTQTIYVASSVGFNDVVQIETLEYFIDTDPGAGNGTSISVSASNNLNLTETLDLTGLNTGFHTLYLRGKLENGAWGPYMAQTILVESSVAQNDVVVIDALEYFIDTDPGAGNGTPISVSPSSLQQLNESIDLSGLANGFHTLYLRGKLQNGTWGPYQSASILTEPGTTDPEIVAIEYFFNTDPGVGTAISANGTFPVAEVVETINLATASLSPGTRKISLRAQDNLGRWGHYLTQEIEVLSPTLNQTMTSGNWNDPATWSTGAVPETSDSVVVAHGVSLDLNSVTVLALTLTTGGDLDLNGNEVHLNGRFKKESAGSLTPSGGTLFMDGGTQIYQHEGNLTFDRLVFAGTGTKILDFDSGNELVIRDSLGIATGILLDFQQDNEIRLTGTAEVMSKGSISSMEKWSLILAGTNHSIDGGDFKDVTFESVATMDLTGSFRYSGSFTSPGTGATLNLNEATVTLGANWTFDGADNLNFGTDGNLFANTETQFSSDVVLPNLTVNNASQGFTMTSALSFASGKFLTIISGEVQSASLSFAGPGGIIMSGGTLTLTNEVITFGNGGTLTNNGGQIQISGSSSAIEGSTLTDNFTMTQNSGGLNWADVTISGTGGNGLSLLGGTATLSNLSFENGAETSYLTFGSGFDDQTFTGFNFGSGPTFNVSILDGIAETIAFDQYQGDLGGPTNDNPGTAGTINWTNEVIPDETPPIVTIDALSTLDLSPALSGTIDESATIVISIAGTSYEDITIIDNSWTLEAGIVGPLDVGVYEVIATATDPSNNVGTDNSNDELTILPASTTASAASAIGTLQFTANWEETSGGVNQYLLDVSEQSDFSTFLPDLENAALTEVNLVVSGLNDNATYFYRVRVQYNSGDISDYSNTIEVTTLEIDETPPVITIGDLATLDLSPAITGTINEPDATIVLTIDGATYEDVTINDNSWTLEAGIVGPLDVGIYEVIATATDPSNNVGTDDSNDELTILPSSTQATAATEVSTDRFTANWSATEGGVSHYLLDVSLESDFTTFLQDLESTSVLSSDTTIAELTSGTNYYYRVRVAYNSGDVSDYSDTIAVSTLSETPEITITTLATLEQSPALSGTVATNVQEVILSIDGVEYTDVIVEEGIWSIAAGIIGPLAVGVYDVMAIATDDQSNTGTDNTTDELTILPAATAALAASDIQSRSFTANWAAASGGVSHYLLDVSEQADFSSFLTALENAQQENLSQIITDLRNNTTYYYRVRVAYNSGDISDYSDTVNVTTNLEVVNESDSLALVQLYTDLNGAEWTDNEQWLLGSVDSWFGVRVNDTRVTDIRLPNNNLSGALGAISSGLNNLDTLDLSQNTITSIGSLSTLNNATYIDVSDNQLQFASLEGLVDVSDEVQYGNQDLILTTDEINTEAGDNLVIDRTVTGDNNLYTWFQDENELTNEGPTLTLENVTEANAGTYFVTVTNRTVPDLILTSRSVTLRINSLEKDREALLELYDALDGPNWNNNADWPNQNPDDLESWEGIDLDNGRVAVIRLGGANLSGVVPESINDLTQATTIDLSANDISGLPDMSVLSNLTSLNVAGNLLDFADLEPNANITGINYQNQQAFGPINEILNLAKDSDYLIDIPVGGSANQYQWSASGPVIIGEIAGGNESTYLIEGIRYENMGSYTVSVTNEIVPNLTLQSHPILVNATTTLNLNPTYLDLDEEVTSLDEGDIYLLKIIAPETPYDSVQTRNIPLEGSAFPEVVLGDYLIAVNTDSLFLRDKGGRTDSVRLLPTYFERTFLWEEADTLLLRDREDRNIRMQKRPDPLTAADGDGSVALLVESNFASDAEKDGNARVEARRKVKRAGCSLRRRRRAGGGRAEDDEFELVVYKETDDNGRVFFDNLPDGTYRLNIEYPGIPMDPDSFVEFEVGAGGIENNSLTLEATVAENGIVVELIEALGFYRKYFKDLQLYPNPADKVLNIRYEKLVSDEVKVQLINLEGKVLMEEYVPNGFNQIMTLDIAEQQEGMYLLRFVDPNAREATLLTYRVLISR